MNPEDLSKRHHAALDLFSPFQSGSNQKRKPNVLRIMKGRSSSGEGDTGSFWLVAAASAITTIVAGGALVALLASTNSSSLATSSTQKKKQQLTSGAENSANSTSNSANTAQQQQQSASNDQLKAFLMRKLMADPNYKIQKEAGKDDDLQKVIMETAKDAMWKIIEEDLKRGDFRRLFALIDEVKQILASITPNRKDLHAELDATLDLDLLRQLLEQQSIAEWDLRPLTMFVVKYIRMLEAPARSDETDAWLKDFLIKLDKNDEEHPSDLPSKVKLLREFFDFCHEKLEQVRLDVTNAFLRQMSPVVSEEGAELLREEFQKRLDAGEITLDHTRSFVNDAYSIDISGVVSDNDKDSLPVHLRRGILEMVLPGGKHELERCDPAMVFRGTGPVAIALPETMAEERSTLEDFVHRGQAIWRIAFAALRIRQIVPDVTPEIMNKVSEILGQKLGNQLEVVSENKPEDGGIQGKTKLIHRQRESVAKKLTEAVIAEIRDGATLHEREEETLRDLLQKCVHPPAGFVTSDATYKIINERLRAVLIGLVVPRPDQTNADEQLKKLQSLRLQPLAEPVIALAQEIRVFAGRDLRIHTQTYAKLVKEMATAK